LKTKAKYKEANCEKLNLYLKPYKEAFFLEKKILLNKYYYICAFLFFRMLFTLKSIFKRYKMKKRILVIMLAVAMPIGSIFAQMSYDHWSIQAKGGLNTIKGLYRTIWDRDYNPEFGGAVEYTFSPLIGIGAEYVYQNNNHSWKSFTSDIQQATVFGSLNISNLTAQYRRGAWQNLNAYLNFGAGMGFGNWEQTSGTKGSIVNLNTSSSINLEYNINKTFAIGLEAQYRWNTNGRYNPPAYEIDKDFYTANLNVRYKIAGSKMHIRNQSYVNYQLDQIANYQHQQNQEVGAKTKMQELLVQQTKKDSLVKDSIKNQLKIDSIAKATALTKQKNQSSEFFMKMGQNAGPQSFKDSKDTLKGVQSDVTKSMPTETIKTKTPIIEPIITKTKEDENLSKKPVSMKTEAYLNTPLKRYSVVVGSFSNKENAEGLSNILKKQNYVTYVVQNEQGMYRVIMYTSNSVGSAVSQVKKMRSQYPDAWIMVLK